MRIDALGALHMLRCAGLIESGLVEAVAGRIMDSYHARDASERLTIARFLETWFIEERSYSAYRRISAARMEEVDDCIRESLFSAAVSAMPSGDLIRSLADPDEEHLLKGLGLLVMLEAVSYRLSGREFAAVELPGLLKVLRAARALRGSHIARPFLWRLEDVISTVTALLSKFMIEA